MRGWEVARRRPELIAWATMRLRWLFFLHLRPSATAGFRMISRGTELRGGRGRVECATAPGPRPGEVGEGGAGDAWRVGCRRGRLRLRLRLRKNGVSLREVVLAFGRSLFPHRLEAHERIHESMCAVEGLRQLQAT